MNFRQTILYIGKMDRHYRDLCQHTQAVGHTLITLPDLKTALRVGHSVDVFIVVVNHNDVIHSKDALRDVRYCCQNYHITLVEIKDDSINIPHSYWM